MGGELDGIEEEVFVYKSFIYENEIYWLLNKIQTIQRNRRCTILKIEVNNQLHKNILASSKDKNPAGVKFEKNFYEFYMEIDEEKIRGKVAEFNDVSEKEYCFRVTKYKNGPCNCGSPLLFDDFVEEWYCPECDGEAKDTKELKQRVKRFLSKPAQLVVDASNKTRRIGRTLLRR